MESLLSPTREFYSLVRQLLFSESLHSPSSHCLACWVSSTSKKKKKPIICLSGSKSSNFPCSSLVWPSVAPGKKVSWIISIWFSYRGCRCWSGTFYTEWQFKHSNGIPLLRRILSKKISCAHPHPHPTTLSNSRCAAFSAKHVPKLNKPVKLLRTCFYCVYCVTVFFTLNERGNHISHHTSFYFFNSVLCSQWSASYVEITEQHANCSCVWRKWEKKSRWRKLIRHGRVKKIQTCNLD